MQQFEVQARLEGVRQIGADAVSGPDLGDDLASFVDAHGQALTKFAYLLTSGNGPHAEDLVQTVLARLVARGLAGLDDPVAYARRGIVNEHASAGRHSQVHERTLPKLVTPQTTESSTRTEDRLAVLAPLGRSAIGNARPSSCATTKTCPTPRSPPSSRAHVRQSGR